MSNCDQEDFTNDQQSFANSLVNYFGTYPSYLKYLEYLNANKNTSVNLVSKSNYTEFLNKYKDGSLIPDFILKKI